MKLDESLQAMRKLVSSITQLPLEQIGRANQGAIKPASPHATVEIQPGYPVGMPIKTEVRSEDGKSVLTSYKQQIDCVVSLNFYGEGSALFASLMTRAHVTYTGNKIAGDAGIYISRPSSIRNLSYIPHGRDVVSRHQLDLSCRLTVDYLSADSTKIGESVDIQHGDTSVVTDHVMRGMDI